MTKEGKILLAVLGVQTVAILILGGAVVNQLQQNPKVVEKQTILVVTPSPTATPSATVFKKSVTPKPTTTATPAVK